MSMAKSCEMGLVGADAASSTPHSLPSTFDAKIGPLVLRTIGDLPRLEALREIWKSWPGSRDSDLDFFSHQVRSRGAACRPHVIVLSRNEEPEAILIGLRESRKVPFRLGQIPICQPMATVLEFVHGGLRGNASSENCTALVRYVVNSLHQGEADAALWEKLEIASPLYAIVRQLQLPVLRQHFLTNDDHYFMNFPQGLDDLWAGLHRNQRSKLRRKYRRVLSCFAGKIQVREFCSVADLDTAASVMEEIASQSEKRCYGFGFFDTPQLREGMVLAAKAGWLKIYVLHLEDKPAAFWMGTLYNRCLQADQVGYGHIWSEFSPGVFLFLNILERLKDADIETVDFGRGSSQLKQCFATSRQAEACAHIYASTPRGLGLGLLSAATHRATIIARRIYGSESARKLLRNRRAYKRSEPHLGKHATPVRR